MRDVERPRDRARPTLQRQDVEESRLGRAEKAFSARTDDPASTRTSKSVSRSVDQATPQPSPRPSTVQWMALAFVGRSTLTV